MDLDNPPKDNLSRNNSTIPNIINRPCNTLDSHDGRPFSNLQSTNNNNNLISSSSSTHSSNTFHSTLKHLFQSSYSCHPNMSPPDGHVESVDSSSSTSSRIAQQTQDSDLKLSQILHIIKKENIVESVLDSRCESSITSRILDFDQIVSRFIYVDLISEAGLLLKLSRSTTCVAITYFHVFANRVDLSRIEKPFILVEAILFIACKAQENHRRLRDIIGVIHNMEQQLKRSQSEDMKREKDQTNQTEQQINQTSQVDHSHVKGDQSKHDDDDRTFIKDHMLHLGNEYLPIRDLVVQNEQLILRFLGFNLNVNLPQPYLHNQLKSMNASHELSRLACSILNDFYNFSIVVEHQPHTLAAAAIFMAQKIMLREEEKKMSGIIDESESESGPNTPQQPSSSLSPPSHPKPSSSLSPPSHPPPSSSLSPPSHPPPSSPPTPPISVWKSLLCKFFSVDFDTLKTIVYKFSIFSVLTCRLKRSKHLLYSKYIQKERLK